MQKRVVYNFNAQTATESAAENSTDKAVKTSNAIGKIKRAFSGKSFKLVVLIVLLFASLFCTIGSADWIISQQKVVPNVAGNSIFKFDDLGFGAHVNNGKPTGNYTFNGSSISISMSVAAVGGVQNLPDSAIKAQNIRYRVKKCAPDTKPENLNEEFFNSGYTTVLPKDAGTYAVLITSEADGVSYGKTIKVFTIAPCPVKIEWSGAVGFTYDGTDHSSNITATARTENGSAVNKNIFKISFSYKAHGATTFTPVTEVKNAGTYTATAEISNNYTISSNEAATFTIEQKALTVTAEDKTVTYGDSAHYTATYKGLLDCDKGKLGAPNFTCNYNKVGTYPITVDGLENSNYAITYVNGTLKVNARTVTLDWGTDNSFIYDGTAHTLKLDAKNVVNNDNLGLTVTVTGENISGSSAINVGTYTATASITNKNYVLAESSKTATFTITARALTIIANNHEIIYGSAPATNGYTISGIIEGETPETANIGGTVKLTTNYTQYGKVGEYDIIVDISGLSSSNYSFTAVNGKLTVNKKELTVTAKNHEITYGEEPSANGYTINGFVNNENESVIIGLENITYIIDYAQWQDIGWFSITPKVDGLSAVNYSFKANSDGRLKVKQLNIQLSGIIERDYDGSEFLFDKNLFTTATATFTAPQNPGIDLKKLPNDIDIYQCISNAGNAQNFDSTNGITVTPENGLFSYAFGKPIEAGSTYKIDKITLNNKNFNLTKTEVYLKYKTAKVGDKFYTIEDALAQSGTITLCGDATSDSSYVITAFSKLSLSAGNGDKFKDYKSDYKYTLSGKKLIASFNDSTKEEDVNSSYDKAGNVFSALVISKGVTITLSSSASMIAAAEIGFSYSICTTLAKNHGVIMNNGNIVVNSGCSVTAYGYIKGNGLIQMNSGATALDALTIYDWPGGDAAKDMYKTAFPTNAYTVHNISCPTKVFSGAIYKARVYLNAVGGTIGLNEPIVIIGTQNNKGMFNADSDSSASDYIFKSVITNQKDIETAKDINSNIALSNQRATGTVTTLNHRDNIEIYGKYSDAPTEISKTVLFITIALKTSTSIPLPVGFMDITVRNKSTLTLNSSDYLILPGAKLTVDNGGTLTLGNNVDIVALPYSAAPTTGNRRYSQYYTTNTDGNGKKDGKLIVNGTLSGSGYSLGGNISTEVVGATLNVANASGSYVTMRHTGKPYYDSGTINAYGDIMTSQNSYAQRNLSTGTYYSTKIDSDYVWFKNSATITYHTNGGTLNETTQNITLPSGGYISSNLPKPTRPYYEFNGWYYDRALTQKATAIFASCDLYAKWTPIQYTIVYNLPYAECGTLVNGSLSGTEVKTLATPPQKTITVDGTEYTFSSWYLNFDRTGDPITEVSAVNANKQNIINVYAFYRGGTYTVNYEEDPENLLHNNNLTAKKPESQTFDKGMAVPESKLNSLNSYNGDTSFMFYFAGWYLSTDSSTIINSLPSTINGDITLCAKWIAKHIVTINFTSNDSILETENRLGTIVKYYKDGEVNLQNLYNDNSIAAKIDEYYAPHGNIKEYTLIEWQENGTVITTNVVNVTRNFDITAYHKRCYYITVQKLNATVNGITGGLGTFYASPLDTTFATAITCTLIANKERYTPEYSAINASVDANGVISFANSNSVENVIVNITTQHWFMVDNQYTSNITLKLDSSTGMQDGNWFTENAKVTVTLKAYATKKTAIIQNNDGTTQTLTAHIWNTNSKDITISGWYIIKKA